MGSLSSRTPTSWSRNAGSTYSGCVNVDSVWAHSLLASRIADHVLVALLVAVRDEARARRQDRVVRRLRDREPGVRAAVQRVGGLLALEPDGEGAVTSGDDGVRVDQRAGAVEPAARIVEPRVLAAGT